MRAFGLEVFRHREALNCYRQGLWPTVSTHLKPHLFIQERARDSTRPDHLLERLEQHQGNGHTTISGWLAHWITDLQKHFLPEQHHKRLYVPADRLREWQDLVTVAPVLVLVAEGLRHRLPSLADAPPSVRAVRTFLDTDVAEQVQYSSLPSVRDPRLDRVIARERLDDLHVHLNGSTDPDRVWIDAMTKTKLMLAELSAAKRAPLLQLLRQIDASLTPTQLIKDIRTAVALRSIIAHAIDQWMAGSEEYPTRVTLDAALTGRLSAPAFPRLQSLPKVVAAAGRGPEDELKSEAVFLVLALQLLHVRPSDVYGHALYAYLLIKSLVQHLLVQQKEQRGFDQFQHITHTQLRSLTEREYVRRFAQFRYQPDGDVETVEGRFSPRADPTDTVKTLQAILAGYLQAKGKSSDRLNLSQILAELAEHEPKSSLRLKLVCHFIKEPEPESKSAYGLRRIRYRQLRSGLEKKWRALLHVIETYPDLRRYLVGFDAASNEKHTPPEVFAPLFRRIRHHRFTNFTYHVGEDFIHLPGGIRAIWEAVQFLDLRDGARIGHGTAIGIDPALWQERFGPVALVGAEELLDDLTVFYHLAQGSATGRVLTRISDRIGALSRRVYGTSHRPELLYAAWCLRRLDPIEAFDPPTHPMWARDEARRQEIAKIDTARRDDPDAVQLWEQYHARDRAFDRHKQPYEEFDTGLAVGSDCLIDADLLRSVQDRVLEELKKRQVAIETLPTSNVRISVYKSHREHHLFRWLGFTRNGPRPDVVVGSDDPGIFATTMRNEYAHILRELEYYCKGTDRKPTDELEHLIENGKRWLFRPTV